MKNKRTLRGILQKKLSEDEMLLVPSSFDIVGDIIIFAEFPDLPKKKEKFVAESFLEFFKNTKVVCKKTRKYAGVFRTPKIQVIAGEKRKETVHKENNCLIKLDVERCYFSPRLAAERKRIASMVKQDEKILVMFSGVAVYPVVIAKNSRAKIICAVEKNPVAHRYAEENLRLNKISNVRLLKGDVRKVVPKIKLRFDRILMPLPKGAEDFLEMALPKLKKSGILHFYDFCNEGEFSKAGEKVMAACAKARRKCRVTNMIRCGQYSPRVYRVCVDVVVK